MLKPKKDKSSIYIQYTFPNFLIYTFINAKTILSDNQYADTILYNINVDTNIKSAKIPSFSPHNYISCGINMNNFKLEILTKEGSLDIHKSRKVTQKEQHIYYDG